MEDKDGVSNVVGLLLVGRCFYLVVVYGSNDNPSNRSQQS